MVLDNDADLMGLNWEISGRDFDVVVERDLQIPVDNGNIELVGDVFQPDTDKPVPTIIGAHPYNNEYQSAPITPKSIGGQLAWVESGDPHYFARRGYAHIILNVRGTGKSGGRFRNLDTREATDIVDAMDWLADQSWCTGKFGMFGVSYFAMIQKKVAEQQPDRLHAIFAPWGVSDLYRDWYYHGGISAHEFTNMWRFNLDNPRAYSWTREQFSDTEVTEQIERLLDDPEIYAHESLVDVLTNPDHPTDALFADTIINYVDNDYYEERLIHHDRCTVPAYLGTSWGSYGLHSPGDFRSWREWAGPKKFLVGPPIYLDRPLYQLQAEAIRWFDSWIKDTDTRIMDEPPVKLFVMNTGEWKHVDDWPVPSTRWVRFYLHDDGLLFERDHWPGEGYTTYEDSPFRHESLDFVTPPLVEATEVVGPIRLNVYASTTLEEALFIVRFLEIDADGAEEELTRGWLRGSMRKTDPERSKPWRAYHPFAERDPLEPGAIYEFNINIKPAGIQFKPGSRIGIRLSSADVDDPPVGEHNRSSMTGHLYQQSASRVTVYHNKQYPSNLLLPITAGNHLGTFYSGGEPTPEYGELPSRYISMDKSVEN